MPAQYITDANTGYECDLDNLVRAIKGDSVLSGMAVTAQSSPDMTVKTASGVVRGDGAVTSVSAVASIAISASDATNDRYDIIYTTTAGAAPTVATGTPAGTPKPPSLPANGILLALVSVTHGATNISNSNITNRILTVGNGFVAGTAAARPAATLVPAGTVYFSTDTDGGTIARSDGSAWTNIAAGRNHSLTTKGDLLTFGSGAATRMGVGSDGQVLVADSAQTNGIKWATGGTPLDVQTFTATGTWTKPTIATPRMVRVILFGAGGGGGGGQGNSTGTNKTGGSGGGGGAYSVQDFDPSILGATETVTVGTAGTSGAGGVSANGTGGGIGGNTSFGTHLFAGGGGGGQGGILATGGAGGGGGSILGAGTSGSGGTNGLGGAPRQLQITLAIQSNIGLGGADGGGNAEIGGGGGGPGGAFGAGTAGGSSVFAGGSGGGAGGETAANAESGGGAGGGWRSYTSGAGGAAGAVNGGAGGNGTSRSGGKAGDGGGGGGSQDSGTGGVGGTGGNPGGGGGGGGAGTSTGGAGGAGGRGEAIIITYF